MSEKTYSDKKFYKDGVILIGVGLSRNVDGTYSGDFDELEVKEKHPGIRPRPGSRASKRCLSYEKSCNELY